MAVPIRRVKLLASQTSRPSTAAMETSDHPELRTSVFRRRLAMSPLGIFTSTCQAAVGALAMP